MPANVRLFSLQNTNFSLSYLSMIQANGAGVTTADMVNAVGYTVSASSTSVQEAMSEFTSEILAGMWVAHLS